MKINASRDQLRAPFFLIFRRSRSCFLLPAFPVTSLTPSHAHATRNHDEMFPVPIWFVACAVHGRLQRGGRPRFVGQGKSSFKAGKIRRRGQSPPEMHRENVSECRGL